MPSLLRDIVDNKGRIKYDDLKTFVRNTTMSEFTAQAPHPFLVGKELYEGEIKQKKEVEKTGSTNTMRFSVADIRRELDARANLKDMVKKETNDNSGITRAVYMLRKNIYSGESNSNIITIGRGSDNDIVIADYVISGHHAQIIIFHGMYFIVDSNSTNGTDVNRKPIAPGMKVQLNSNSLVSFGRFAFNFLPSLDLYRSIRTEAM